MSRARSGVRPPAARRRQDHEHGRGGLNPPVERERQGASWAANRSAASPAEQRVEQRVDSISIYSVATANKPGPCRKLNGGRTQNELQRSNKPSSSSWQEILASERLAFMRSGSRLGDPGDTRDSLATPPPARQRFLYGPEKLYWSTFNGDKCTNQPEKLSWSTFYGYKCEDPRSDIGVFIRRLGQQSLPLARRRAIKCRAGRSTTRPRLGVRLRGRPDPAAAPPRSLRMSLSAKWRRLRAAVAAAAAEQSPPQVVEVWPAASDRAKPPMPRARTHARTHAWTHSLSLTNTHTISLSHTQPALAQTHLPTRTRKGWILRLIFHSRKHFFISLLNLSVNSQ